MISKRLFILLTCLFVVMIGFGITLPVLPFYVERLALAEGASRQSVVLHVGMLTGVYVLMQLIFAPVWALVGSHRQKTSHLDRHRGPISWRKYSSVLPRRCGYSMRHAFSEASCHRQRCRSRQLMLPI